MNQNRMMDYFFELFEQLPQQAPGSSQSTARAWQLLPPLTRRPRILDAGSGNGRQTIELVRLSGGQVTAIDVHQPFLVQVDQRAREAHLEERVRTLITDMGELDFPRRFFDIIWSEGAIYNIGFEEGLTHWRRFLRKPGLVVVTECCWLTETRSPECVHFWSEEYPEMPTVQQCTKAAVRAGYELLETFVLPDSDWMENYYAPMETALEAFEQQHGEVAEARAVIKMCRKEIAIRREFGEEYGYVCFVLQRTSDPSAEEMQTSLTTPPQQNEP